MVKKHQIVPEGAGSSVLMPRKPYVNLNSILENLIFVLTVTEAKRSEAQGVCEPAYP